MNVRMGEQVRRLQRDERGLTTVEYVIVLCLIAGLAVGSWQTFGDNVKRYLDKTTTDIEATMPK